MLVFILYCVCGRGDWISSCWTLDSVVTGLEPGVRSQGQVTSSSECGLGSPLGAPGQSMGQSANKEIPQGISITFLSYSKTFPF